MGLARRSDGHFHDVGAVIAAGRPGLRKLGERTSGLVAEFRERGLAVHAGNLAYEATSAIAPVALFLLALMGFLNLQDLYVREVAPSLQQHMSAAAFTVVDDTVREMLGSKRGFWLTLGAALALWRASACVRAVMSAFNTVYGTDEDRTAIARYLRSAWLAVAVLVLLLAALAVVALTPLLYGDTGIAVSALLFLVRWAVAIALLGLAVGLLVRFAPATHQPIGWVSAGSAIVVAGWALMSLGFGFYLRVIADYGSAFGNLATVVILLAYLYASSVTFLGGALADALVRKEVDGTRTGS
jgi:membrane protein